MRCNARVAFTAQSSGSARHGLYDGQSRQDDRSDWKTNRISVDIALGCECSQQFERLSMKGDSRGRSRRSCYGSAVRTTNDPSALLMVDPENRRDPTGLSCRPKLGRFINFARRTSFSDICQRLLAISFIVHPRSMASNPNGLTAKAPPQRGFSIQTLPALASVPVVHFLLRPVFGVAVPLLSFP